MKKKIIMFAPYAAGCAYAVYCLFNINGWVKSHSDIGIYVLIPADNRRNCGGAVFGFKAVCKEKV